MVGHEGVDIMAPMPSSESPPPCNQWTAQTVGMGPEILNRMERAMAKVRERLLRATRALNQSGIPYAVFVGGKSSHRGWLRLMKAECEILATLTFLFRRTDLPAVLPRQVEQAGFVAGTCFNVVMSRWTRRKAQ